MSTSQRSHESLAPYLTPRQLDVIDALPGTTPQLADDLGLSESRVRAYITEINGALPVSEGITTEGYGGEYVKSDALVDLINDNEEETDEPDVDSSDDEPFDETEFSYTDGETEREASETNRQVTNNHRNTYVTPKAKSSVTKEFKEWAEQMERHVNTVLDETEPAISAASVPSDYEQDVIIHRSDDHIGDVVEDEYGEEIYNPSMAVNAIRKVTSRSIQYADLFSGADDVGTVHLLLGGDTVTGENIYDGQAHNICLTLTEQVELAVLVYYQQIQNLSERFPNVQVVCQRGNHGELRGSGMSDEANADTLVYKWLDAMVRLSQNFGALENVTFIQSDANKYTNFTVRGHKAHLRHGQDALEHIGTSAGKKKWYHWKDRHDYDIAFRGHYHEFKVESISESPILMSGSLCPPDDYEDSLAEYSQPTATVVGVTDDHPMAWVAPVYFN